MNPEIKIEEKMASKLVLGIPCSQEDCGGEIQTYERIGEPIKACCYRCGEEIDLGNVRVIYGKKEDK